MTAFLPRFLWTFVVLALLIMPGTLGYAWIEGPSLATKIDAGDAVIVLGDAEQIQRLRTYLT